MNNTTQKNIMTGINAGIEAIKYIADKKTSASKYHDDTLREMNRFDNSCKDERLNKVIALLTPLVAAGALILERKAKKKH